MDQGHADRAIELTLKGPLHVGEWVGVSGEGAHEWVPSDTLFGALVSAWAALGRDLPTLLAGFRSESPPFLIGSAFPRAGGVRFYPRPWLRMRPANLLERKRAKRLRWVSGGIMERMLRGDSLLGQEREGRFLQGERAWITGAERAALPDALREGEDRAWGYQAAPRVTVDRSGSASNLFHSGRVDFAPGCGLWFALRYLDPDPVWRERVEAALDVLADAGLGGLRSVGHGAFSWSEAPSLLSLSGGGGAHAITLSRYAPRDAAELRSTLLEDARTAYRLATVGGWCRDDALHTWRRRSVRLIAEGSLLACGGRAAPGRLVDVTPQRVGAFGPGHRVERYGYAFPAAVGPAALSAEEEGA